MSYYVQNNIDEISNFLQPFYKLISFLELGGVFQALNGNCD